MKRNITLTTIVVTAIAVMAIWGCGGGGGGSSSSPMGTTGSTTGGTTGSSTGTTTGTPSTMSIAAVNDASAPMGFSFQSPVTVKSGTHVTWNNNSSAPHSIVWDNFSPSSSPAPGANIGVFSPGTSSAVWVAPTVTTNTTYNYHCGVHGPTMNGVVIVTP